MPEISGRTLVLAVKAVDAEIRRLRSLSDEEALPEDDELLLKYENAAEELEDAYAVAAQSITNLPAYSQLVRRDD
jgi:hypothetical protein